MSIFIRSKTVQNKGRSFWAVSCNNCKLGGRSGYLLGFPSVWGGEAEEEPEARGRGLWLIEVKEWGGCWRLGEGRRARWGADFARGDRNASIRKGDFRNSSLDDQFL